MAIEMYTNHNQQKLKGKKLFSTQSQCHIICTHIFSIFDGRLRKGFKVGFFSPYWHTI